MNAARRFGRHGKKRAALGYAVPASSFPSKVSGQATVDFQTPRRPRQVCQSADGVVRKGRLRGGNHGLSVASACAGQSRLAAGLAGLGCSR